MDAAAAGFYFFFFFVILSSKSHNPFTDCETRKSSYRFDVNMYAKIEILLEKWTCHSNNPTELS